MTLGTSQEVNTIFCIGIDEISANYEDYQKDDMVHIDFPIIYLMYGIMYIYLWRKEIYCNDNYNSNKLQVQCQEIS